MERFANVNEHDAKVLMEIEKVVGYEFVEMEWKEMIQLEYNSTGIYYTTNNNAASAVAFINVSLDTTLIYKLLSQMQILTSLIILKCIGINKPNISLSAIQNIPKLTRLRLQKNSFLNIKPLRNLIELRELYVTESGIKDITPLSNLKKLEYLNLSKNKIINTSPLISLIKLKYLNLSNNYIFNISLLSNSLNLQRLYVSFNNIADIAFLSNLNNLQKLELIHNQISDIAPLSSLIDLRELHLSGNQISNLTPITNLTNLQNLYLYNNQISDIAPLSNLIDLRELHLTSNQIFDITPITNLVFLQKLHLSGNQISNLTPIANLNKIQELYLSINQISDITPLSNMRNLQDLYLSNNQIFDIAPLSNLNNLNRLDLADNQIQSIPQEIYAKSQYTRIRYDGNPIIFPPLAVLKQGYEVVINYYKQLEEQGKIHLNECKLLILGDAGVGKTSLSKKIINKDAKLPTEEEYTKGADVTTYQFSYTSDGKELNYKAHIWDFGGQTIYYNLHRYFMTDKSLYILVLDSNDTGTHFTEWLWTQKNYGSDSPLLVVSNHKRGNENAPNLNRYVPAFPNIQTPMYHVNLKNIESPQENQRYKNILETIQLKIKQLPIISESVPSLWGKIRESLEEIKKSKNYISREKFDEICEEHHLTNAEDINTMLGYFHNIGVVLCYQQNSNISDIIVLNMKWILDTTYSILNDKTIATAQAGKFSNADFKKILKVKQQDSRLISNLMEEFKIIYNNEQGYYITPALLPDNNDCVTQFDTYHFDKEIYQQFIYEFAMPVPVGLFHQLIVNLHDYIHNELVSRYEVILFKQNTFVLITESPTNNTIKIELKSTDIEDLKGFQAVIMEKMEQFKKEKSLLVTLKIPCICHECRPKIKNQADSAPHFYDYDREIKKYKAARIDKIRCLESLKEVAIDELYGYLLGKSVVYCAVGDNNNLNISNEIKNIDTFIGNSSKIELKYTYNATIDDLITNLQTYFNRLVIFHFAGHANPEKLLMENSAAYPNGLSSYFKNMPRLKVVILNGCSTAKQVEYLISAGIPIVIATTKNVLDDNAIDFSKIFYKALSQQETIQQAYNEAIHFIRAKNSMLQNRTMESHRKAIGIPSLKKEDTAALNEDWVLFYNPSKQDMLNFKLF